MHLSSRARWVASGTAVLLIVAAGLTWILINRSSGEYETVRELVRTLDEYGVDCTKLTVSPPDQAERVGGEFGSCLIDGTTVNIHVYDDLERAETHVELNLQAREISPENENLFTSGVHASNWVVDTYSRDVAIDVQEALGGRVY